MADDLVQQIKNILYGITPDTQDRGSLKDTVNYKMFHWDSNETVTGFPPTVINTAPQFDDRMKAEAVVVFGRFQPPHLGHKILTDRALQESAADHFVFATHSYGDDENPLPYETKLNYMQETFDPNTNIVFDPFKRVRTVFEAVQYCANRGYTGVKLVVGSDRAEEFGRLAEKYNGKENGFAIPVTIISAADRTSSGEDATAFSGTALREAVANNDFDAFKEQLPGGIAESLWEALLEAKFSISKFDKSKEKPSDKELEKAKAGIEAARAAQKIISEKPDAHTGKYAKELEKHDKAIIKHETILQRGGIREALKDVIPVAGEGPEGSKVGVDSDLGDKDDVQIRRRSSLKRFRHSKDVVESTKEDNLHFEIEHSEHRGKKKTVFTEKPRNGKYKRGEHPIQYHYHHDSGNMDMTHHDLYAKKPVLSRTGFGGAPPGPIGDHKVALTHAVKHLGKYKGDGKSYTQRAIDNKQPTKNSFEGHGYRYKHMKQSGDGGHVNIFKHDKGHEIHQHVDSNHTITHYSESGNHHKTLASALKAGQAQKYSHLKIIKD